VAVAADSAGHWYIDLSATADFPFAALAHYNPAVTNGRVTVWSR
jgi:hypothetical protein